ncbi:MAG: hypothetical protein HC846_09920 [Blastocatellia bacterium]|nr:hypothetical protein [Blastocatellia bacterium]
MIIFSIPRDKIDDGPSIPGCKFIRYDKHGELLKDLPLGYRISSYACGVLRSPRDLVTIIRQNKSKPSPFTENLGADKDALGMYLSPQKFEKFTPPPPVFPSESLFYSSFNQDQFLFLDEKFNAHQDRYLDEMIKLLKAKEVPLVILNVPQYRESKLNKVIEYHDWSKKFGMETPLIGIPPTVLFNGLSDKEIEKFHYEEDHMNVNGMEYFTKAVLPAILEVYENVQPKTFKFLLYLLIVSACIGAFVLFYFLPFRAVDTGIVYQDF